MPVKRKVFRIEMMSPIVAPDMPLARGAVPALHHQEILAELRALRDLIELRAAGAVPIDAGKVDPNRLQSLKDETDTIHRTIERTKQEIASLHAGAFSGPGPARAVEELDAVAADTENATQRILAAAEEIDRLAKRLDASLARAQDRELTQQILDQAIRIFEVCNFQDIGGQRITKVLAALKFVEDHVTRMMGIWGGIEAFKHIAAPVMPPAQRPGSISMYGPKLDGDPGHASQDDIDELFASH